MRVVANYNAKVKAEVEWGAESTMAERENIVLDPDGKGTVEIVMAPWLLKDLTRQFNKARKRVEL